MFNRVIVIVIDGFGVGNAKDAAEFNDQDANTALHVIDKGNLNLNSFRQLGLYNILGKEPSKTIGYYTTSEFINKSKDSLASHREMLGIPTTVTYNCFPNGLPAELIQRIEAVTGKKVIGNKKDASMDIFEEFGEEHLNTTGSLIVYTSDESVIQVAAHIRSISPDELYALTAQIRAVVDEKPEWMVSRVTARPFTGYKTKFERSPNRKDFVQKLTSPCLLNKIKEYSYQTVTIGKVGDFFNASGISKNYPTFDNLDTMNKIVETIKEDFNGMIFANINDLDSNYGHKRDLYGYTKCLIELDSYLPIIVNATKPTDLLIITADHGNDPTLDEKLDAVGKKLPFIGTGDHTRENVPVFIYSKRLVDPKPLEPFTTVADIGATIAEIFDVNYPELGTSFLSKLS